MDKDVDVVKISIWNTLPWKHAKTLSQFARLARKWEQKH